MKRAMLLIAFACSKPAATADKFWPYFSAHAEQLRAESLEAAMDQLQRAVEVAHHGVIIEMASLHDERTLVLSADGDRAAFPEVQALYAVRPTVPHWTIVAFRQRDPASFHLARDGLLRHRRRPRRAAPHGQPRKSR